MSTPANDSEKSVKTSVDWELIERDYRAGILSVREIAASQGISHAAINKRAKRDGWERDLAAKIQAKAEALVSKREVSTQVSTERLVTERAIVEGNAMRVAEVRMSHRADIRRLRNLAISMLEELEAETRDIALFNELGELLRAEDDKGQDKRNDLYNKVISSAQRIDSMKKLAETLKILIGIEREAYGIVSGESDPDADKAFRAKVVIVPQKQAALIETRPLAHREG
jgi:hypothetical protein